MRFHYGREWASRFLAVGVVLAAAAAVIWILNGPVSLVALALLMALALGGAAVGASLVDEPPPLYRVPDLVNQLQKWEEERARPSEGEQS